MTKIMSKEVKVFQTTLQTSLNETLTLDFLLVIETFSTKTLKNYSVIIIKKSAKRYALTVNTERKAANQ